jgi:hypothetical protein
MEALQIQLCGAKRDTLRSEPCKRNFTRSHKTSTRILFEYFQNGKYKIKSVLSIAKIGENMVVGGKKNERSRLK